MLDAAAYTPRLKAEYNARIRAALTQDFGYTNPMQLPRLDKIVLNMGVGEAVKDTKKVKTAAEQLTLIAGQKAVITHAKKSSLMVMLGATRLSFWRIWCNLVTYFRMVSPDFRLHRNSSSAVSSSSSSSSSP